MKKIYYLLTSLLLLQGVQTVAQTDGDYRSIADGAWTSLAVWQTRSGGNWIAATSLPGATNNVYIQDADDIAVGVNSASANLHIHTTATVTVATTIMLDVNGKIRAYTGAQSVALGADGTFYSAQVNSTNPGANTVSGPGVLRFVGNTRSITLAGEWGANGLTGNAVIEFALTAGQTGTLNTGFKAETITISSGNIDMGSNRLAPDGGNPNTGTLTISGGNLISSQSGTSSSNQVASRTGTTAFDVFNLQSGGTLTLNGATPSIDANNVTLNGTVIYGAAGAQTFLQRGQDNGATFPTYTNVILDGTGAKTLSQNTTVNGTLTMRGSPTAASLALGTFTFGYGATGTLEYAGPVAQTTTAAEWPSVAAPFNIIINNTNGVTLNAARQITGNLQLTIGDLITTNTNLLTLTALATTSGGSASSHVNGPLSKTGSTTFEFPVGNGTLYRPIEISTLSASATVRATYFQVNPKTTFGATLSGGLQQVSACEYWDLDDGVATITFITKLTFGNSCNASPYVTDPASLRVAYWSGTQWENLGNDGTATLTFVRATIASLAGPFTIGSINSILNPLPVRFSTIKAVEKTNAVQIEWTVYQEENLLNYVVERSANGTNFTTIGTVTARNVPGSILYSFLDATPLAGINFYRLRHVDLDSRQGLSNIVKVNLDKNNSGFTLYPNPVRSGYVSYQSSNLAKGNYTVKLLNAAGQQVYVQKFNHAGGAINQTLQLPAVVKAGMYTLQLESTETKVMTRTFVVQ